MLKIKNRNFIFIHDQDVLLEKENLNFYNNIEPYCYVFIGENKINKLDNLIKNKRIIVSRHLKFNIDSFDKKILAFAGWYSLAKNNICQPFSFIGLFEYDIIPITKIKFNYNYYINGFIKAKTDSNSFFYKNKCIQKESKEFLNLSDSIDEKVYDKKKYWCSTSNFVFEKNTFLDFTNWYYKICMENIDDSGICQVHERIISYFALINNLKINYNKNVILHEMKNSHGFEYK